MEHFKLFSVNGVLVQCTLLVFWLVEWDLRHKVSLHIHVYIRLIKMFKLCGMSHNKVWEPVWFILITDIPSPKQNLLQLKINSIYQDLIKNNLNVSLEIAVNFYFVTFKFIKHWNLDELLSCKNYSYQFKMINGVVI